MCRIYTCITSVKHLYCMCYTCITGVGITCVINLKHHTCITCASHIQYTYGTFGSVWAWIYELIFMSFYSFQSYIRLVAWETLSDNIRSVYIIWNPVCIEDLTDFSYMLEFYLWQRLNVWSVVKNIKQIYTECI